MYQVPASILFVCTGNTCRSPMAAALCSDLIEKYYPQYRGKININSAGCAAFAGSPATREAIQVMEKRNISLHNHKAQKISGEMLKHTDLVITMGEGHYQQLTAEWPHADMVTYTLRELAGETGDISDPIGWGEEVYRKTAEELERLLKTVLVKLLGEPRA